jgi:predicted lipid-binding transport protein (Tim44 family)
VCALTDAGMTARLPSPEIRRSKETTMATASTTPTAVALPTRLVAGIVGGLAGGVMFGILMQMMGMIPMVAMLVGSKAVAVGWLVHLAISAFIGATYALLFARWATGLVPAALIGMGYGVVWWVLGALLVMPAKLGMPTFMFNTTAWQSLMGHLIYGLVLGLVYALVRPRLHRT